MYFEFTCCHTHQSFVGDTDHVRWQINTNYRTSVCLCTHKQMISIKFRQNVYLSHVNITSTDTTTDVQNKLIIFKMKWFDKFLVRINNDSFQSIWRGFCLLCQYNVPSSYLVHLLKQNLARIFSHNVRHHSWSIVVDQENLEMLSDHSLWQFSWKHNTNGTIRTFPRKIKYEFRI